jgi:hypothetical protein
MWLSGTKDGTKCIAGLDRREADSTGAEGAFCTCPRFRSSKERRTGRGAYPSGAQGTKASPSCSRRSLSPGHLRFQVPLRLPDHLLLHLQEKAWRLSSSA